MLGAAIGSAVLGTAGGLLGSSAQTKGANAAADAMKAALARAQQLIDEVGAPPDLSKAIILDQFARAGILTPQMEEAVNIGVSKVAQIQEDQNLRKFQLQALEQMSQRGKAGLTPAERAEMNKSRADVQRDLEAKNQQIMQNMAMRGQAGAGGELAARLVATQEGADRASEEADRIQATASERALQAIAAASGMAGSLRGQDFSTEQTKASAEDEFNRFNVQNQVARQQRNVLAGNQGQEYNLNALQLASDRNVTQANEEKRRQVEAQRQYWVDKLNYAQARANPTIAYGQVGAQQAQQLGNIQANKWTNLGNLGAKTVSSIYSSGIGSSSQGSPGIMGNPKDTYNIA